MENNLTAAEKRKKFWYELKDLMAGAAFPIMLMLILSASIISFSDTDDIAISVVVLVFGEMLLIAAYIIFGRQNGITAVRRYVQQSKKREVGADDLKARFYTGEYALYKGIVIGLISCVPYIIIQIIGSAAPNTVCDFLLKYAFGWAYFPLSYSKASTWANLVFVIPLTAVHAVAYFFGAALERRKQAKVAEVQSLKGKTGKK